MREREPVWRDWMIAANRGDDDAYRRLLLELAPTVRGLARRAVARTGLSAGDVEDVVQETLLAIHLKRQTWDEALPIGPWIGAIARNKAIDMLRHRGHRTELPIDDFVDTLPATDTPEPLAGRDVDRMLATLSPRSRDIVRSVSVDGASIRDTGARLGMTEGAVRVALHRALSTLSARLRKDGT